MKYLIEILKYYLMKKFQMQNKQEKWQFHP